MEGESGRTSLRVFHFNFAVLATMAPGCGNPRLLPSNTRLILNVAACNLKLGFTLFRREYSQTSHFDGFGTYKNDRGPLCSGSSKC
jgi:hypothetical protein